MTITDAMQHASPPAVAVAFAAEFVRQYGYQAFRAAMPIMEREAHAAQERTQ